MPGAEAGEGAETFTPLRLYHSSFSASVSAEISLTALESAKEQIVVNAGSALPSRLSKRGALYQPERLVE